MGVPPYCTMRQLQLCIVARDSQTYLGDEDLVAGGEAGGYPLAVLVEGAGADGQDLGLVQLLDRALREEDARGSLGLGLYPLDQDAVEEGSNGLDGLDRGRLFAQVISRVRRSGAGKTTYHCGGGRRIDAGSRRRGARLEEKSWREEW